MNSLVERFKENNPFYDVTTSIKEWFENTDEDKLVLVFVEEDKLEQIEEVLGYVNIEEVNNPSEQE